MNIAIDIDEVVAEFLQQLLKYYKKEKGKKFKKTDFNSYDFWETWGGTREQAVDIVHNFHKSKHFDEVKTVKGSVNIIKKLSQENHIFFLTSRPIEWKEKTQSWFEKHFDPFPFEIIYTNDFHTGKTSETKLSICQKNKVDLIIEDHKKYATECAENGIHVILIKKPWNKGIKRHKNIKKVKNWNEIEKYLGCFFS